MTHAIPDVRAADVARARHFSLGPSSRKGRRQRWWRSSSRGAVPRLGVVGLAVLLCAAGGPCAALAAGQQTLVSLYWPMNDGDVLNYSGSGDTSSRQTQEDDSSFDLPGFWIDVSGNADFIGSLFYAYSVNMDQLFIYAEDVLGEIDFDPLWLLLDDNLLKSGGTKTESFTASVPGVTNINMVVTERVSAVGEVTIPAGTYANCRQVVFFLRAAGMAIGGNAFVLAPSVGPVEVGLVTVSLQPADWQSLTEGTVGGVDVTTLAGAYTVAVSASPTGGGTATGGGTFARAVRVP